MKDVSPQKAARDGAETGRPGGRSKVSQDKAWASIREKAEKICRARPDDHLVSILADLREVDIGRSDPGNFYRKRDLVKPLGESIMGRAGAALDETFLYPDVAGGEYSVGSVSKIRYLSRLIRPETTAVVEVGAGWSSNLFQLYLARGATRSRKIIYYGGEYTTSGILCGRFLAERDPHLKYRGFRFDYRNPDVRFLVRQRGHILFFTCHSIEQVEDIDPSLFEQLREIPNPVTLVHFEPVGWQRRADLLERRNSGDEEFFSEIGRRVEAGEISPVAENAAWWSWRLSYNRNLLGILDGLERQEALRAVRRIYDFNGVGNVLNPTTLLHYEFVR